MHVSVWAAFTTSVCGVASLAVGWDVSVRSVSNALAHNTTGCAPPCPGLLWSPPQLLGCTAHSWIQARDPEKTLQL